MPSCKKLLLEFGIKLGVVIDSFVLISVDYSPLKINRYKQYDYNICLVFKNINEISNTSFYFTIDNILNKKISIYANKYVYRCNMLDITYIEHNNSLISINFSLKCSI